MSLTRPLIPGVGIPTGRRRPARRRARVSVAWGVVGFAVATAAFAEYANRTVSFRDPAYVSKERKLLAARSARVGPTVVAFGSSRTQCGFDGAGAEAAFAAKGVTATAMNFGFPGSGIVSQSLFLRRARDVGAAPDYVLVELFPAFLHDSPEGPVERNWLDPSRLSRAERRQVGPFMKSNGSAFGSWEEYRRTVLGRTAPSFLSSYAEAAAQRKEDARGYLRNEYRPRDKAERDKLGDAQRDLYYPLLHGLSPTGVTAGLTRRFDAEEGAAGTRIRFVLFPEASSMRSWYGPEAERRLADYLATFRAPIVDARSWVSDSGFSDSHHLNVDGSRAFTDRLTAEVILPWLRGDLP
jgi:hypothetical protein